MTADYINKAAHEMAAIMNESYVPMYGTSLRLPDRGEVIGILKDMRRVMFPAYYGDPALMSLDCEAYVALMLNRIEKNLTRQISLALPEEKALCAGRITREVIEQFPAIQRKLLRDIDALYDGDPAAHSHEEVAFAYPGLFAIFAYRVAHELEIRKVPMLPRIMTEYAHNRTGIDIHPGATIGEYFFIDHGTGIVIGETSHIGDHVKLYQGVTLGGLSPRAGHNSASGKRHPTVENGVTIYSGASILGGETVIGENAVVGGNAFLTTSVEPNTHVSITPPEVHYREKK